MMFGRLYIAFVAGILGGCLTIAAWHVIEELITRYGTGVAVATAAGSVLFAVMAFIWAGEFE